MAKKYLNVTQEAGRNFVQRNISGNVVMLNLLKFKAVADYAQSPELAPAQPISGEEAYQKYIEHTLPFLKASGGEMLFYGEGGHFLIGPEEEYWEVAMLIRQKSVDSFLTFESNAAYQQGIGHRTAALKDSRLLPLVENLTIVQENED
ncbi:MAG: DUF1330 domain-containing protein [Crocinitomicaceae bacterium]|nr:DUF1330 domain-containing protein [Crocinitomicaceae bacterium]|tara:strand:+ start:221 stop:664 length:444 start_codon:yes stop_codon:yes gene_type:complete